MHLARPVDADGERHFDVRGARRAADEDRRAAAPDARQRVAQRGQDIAAFQDCQVDLGQQRGMQWAALAVADQDGAGIGRGADGACQADADGWVGYLGDANAGGFE